MKIKLINKLGILGVISFLSYASAVAFAPLAYPGYNWMQQAVSDLSAMDAPSKVLWNQISCLYGVCAITCLTLLCVFVEGRLSRTLRAGIYTFTVMNWVSYVGYAMFPLTSSGYSGTFQDIMHMVVTAMVVLLSIVSLILFITGGLKEKQYRKFAIVAGIAFIFMMSGPIGIALAPKSVFGIFERFSTMSVVVFTMYLGICLMGGDRLMPPNKIEICNDHGNTENTCI